MNDVFIMLYQLMLKYPAAEVKVKAKSDVYCIELEYNDGGVIIQYQAMLYQDPTLNTASYDESRDPPPEFFSTGLID